MTELTYIAPRGAAPVNHGRTTASWTLVWLLVAGVLVAGIGFAVDRAPVLIAGLVIAVGGLVAGAVMRRLGMGQPTQVSAARDWYTD
nr:hypothetical protein [Actinomycetales bacterium]